MNPNGEIKLKTALFRERALKHVGDFCLSCLYLFRIKNSNLIKNYEKIKIFVLL